MFWMVLLVLVVGFVFFNLGVLTVWFGILEAVGKALFVVSGAFLVYIVWKRIARRRHPEWERLEPRR